MSKRFIRKEVLEKVRILSAFDYLKNYAPDLLVKNGRTDYYYRNHGFLAFFKWKWYWWSQGKGGTSALDYLIIVEGYEFKDACNYLSDLMNVSAPVTTFYHPKPAKPFELPVKDKNNDLVIRYLCEVRKIDKDIVDDFISKGMIYQSANFKMTVFVDMIKINQLMRLSEASLRILNWIMLEAIRHLALITQIQKVMYSIFLKQSLIYYLI